MYLSLGKEGARPVNRVTGARGEDIVAGIDKRFCNVGDPVLGSHQGEHFLPCIEGDAEALLVPACHGALVGRHASVGRIVVVSGSLLPCRVR